MKVDHFLDDQFTGDIPHRYITDWSLRVQKNRFTNRPQHESQNFDTNSIATDGSICISLPESDEFFQPTEHIQFKESDQEPDYYQYAFLSGWLLPGPEFTALPKIKVEIHRLKFVCMDPTKGKGRGYWIASIESPHTAYYWLQKPAPEMETFMLRRRAQLGIISNLLDCGHPKVWADQDPASLHASVFSRTQREPFSLELIRAFGPSMQRHFLQIFSPTISPRSPFVAGMMKMKKVVGTHRTERFCEASEARSQQHSWGGPLENQVEESDSIVTHAMQESVEKIGRKRRRGKNEEAIFLSSEMLPLREAVEDAHIAFASPK